MEPSPIVSIYDELRTTYPKWQIVIGKPCGDGWVHGTDFQTAMGGPFNSLLTRMGEEMGTADRRTIAGLFALRYGGSFGMAIGPYVLYRCIPRITLDNVSLLFNEKTRLSGIALHEPLGVTLAQRGVVPHPSMLPVYSREALLEWLRDGMVRQAESVVGALHEWSRFSLKGIWGLIASSWGEQFINLRGSKDSPGQRIRRAREFFDGDVPVSRVQPEFYQMTFRDVSRVYQRRSACCRYYKLPEKHYCTSCPLVSEEERMQRNKDRMARLS